MATHCAQTANCVYEDSQSLHGERKLVGRRRKKGKNYSQEHERNVREITVDASSSRYNYNYATSNFFLLHISTEMMEVPVILETSTVKA